MDLQAPETPTMEQEPAVPVQDTPRDLPETPAALEEVDLNSSLPRFEHPKPQRTPSTTTLEDAVARPRSDTVSTTARDSLSSSATNRPPKLLSGLLITQSLEQLLASKEGKKNVALKEATQGALDAFRSTTATLIDPRVVLKPLRLACETRTNTLMILALDCIGKLVSQAGPTAAAASGPSEDASRRSSIASVDSLGTPTIHISASDPDLASQVVEIVCGCFIDTSSGSTSTSQSASSQAAAKNPTGPEAVNLHILSALLALILSTSDALPVHQSALLLAVRTVYNIFLLSKGQQNQMVAQGALGQIVGAVFGKVQLNYRPPPAQRNGSTKANGRGMDSGRSSVDTLRGAPVPDVRVDPPAEESEAPADRAEAPPTAEASVARASVADGAAVGNAEEAAAAAADQAEPAESAADAPRDPAPSTAPSEDLPAPTESKAVDTNGKELPSVPTKVTLCVSLLCETGQIY
jgi:brefeldin A-inhibited guanine nucleotide-exchange protein